MENITEKKKAIFDSTLKLVKEYGFHGCPMSLVAKNASVAAGTIYHYFDSKDQLIVELYNYTIDKVINAATAGDDTSQPYQERFFNFWKNLYGFYTQNPDVLRFFEQYVNSPYYMQTNEEGFRGRFHELIYNFFKEGINQGVLRDVNPEILSVLAHGSIVTTAKVCVRGNSALESAEFEQIAQIIWDGMVRRHDN